MFFYKNLKLKTYTDYVIDFLRKFWEKQKAFYVYHLINLSDDGGRFLHLNHLQGASNGKEEKKGS